MPPRNQSYEMSETDTLSCRSASKKKTIFAPKENDRPSSAMRVQLSTEWVAIHPRRGFCSEFIHEGNG